MTTLLQSFVSFSNVIFKMVVFVVVVVVEYMMNQKRGERKIRKQESMQTTTPKKQ